MHTRINSEFATLDLFLKLMSQCTPEVRWMNLMMGTRAWRIGWRREQ